MTKILVADDNATNVDVLVQFFNMKGYQVLIASNGEDALDLVASDPPDMIIMDMSMPILNGWETTQRLKSNPSTKHIPILALTAHAMKLDQQRAMDAGCDGYMVKPMDLFELDATIHSLLSRR